MYIWVYQNPKNLIMNKKTNINFVNLDSNLSMKNPNSSSYHHLFNEQKYFNFFDYAPVSLWIEDFSKTQNYVQELASKNNTDVKTYIHKNPDILPKLAALVTVKEVNTTAVKMYKAKNKKDLLENLTKVFTPDSNKGFSKLVTDLLIGNTETEVETVNKTFTGETINTLVKFKVVEGFEKSLENVIVSVEDITESVKMKNTLLDNENRHIESEIHAKTGSWFYCYQAQKLYWSKGAFKIFELQSETSNESLDLNSYLSYVHKDDKDKVKNFSIDYLKKNKNQEIKYRIQAKNGVLKYILEKRTVVVENNRIVKVLGILQDISKSVVAEKRLNVTKNILSNTLSSIKDGFVILDSNSNYVFINNEAANLLGRSSNSLIGKNIWKEFPEKKGDVFYDNYQKAIKTNTPVSFENYFAPWNRWFENRIIPSNEGIIMFFNEITDQKNTQNKIKAAYNIINKSSSVAILCKNERDFPVIFASENCDKLFGYSYLDFLQNKLNIYDVVYDQDLEYIRTIIFNLSKSNNSKSFKPKPFRIITKNKKIKWVETNLDTIKNNHGEITHIQGIVEDITERKRTEDLLFESNQRLKDQFNNTPLASIMWDLDYRIIEWNNSAERIFGYTAEEVKGKVSIDLLTPPHLISKMEKLREQLFNKHDSLKNTNENITKNGDIIVCDWYTVVLRDAQNKIIGRACLVDDITENINSKKLLEKSEKKYRAIFEKSVDAVLILKNGVFVDCNQATLTTFGFKNKKKLLKANPTDISPKKQPDGSISNIKSQEMIAIALEKGSHRFIWYHMDNNGRVFPTEVTLTKIEESNKDNTVHAVVRDITDKIKQEEIEKVIYTISNASQKINNFKEFSSLVKDELHKIIDTTNFYIALYNKETDMINTPFSSDEMEDFNEFPAKNSLTGHVIKTKKPLFITNKEHHKMIENGDVDLIGVESKVWLGVPLKIKDDVIGAIVVQSYVNENAFKQNDVQLLEFVSEQISTSIERIKFENELKEALAKAQESDKLKSAFLANMSHEIRTPMNGIIGFSELFLEPNLQESERKKYAKIVINSSQQLLSIVNDILDISKIEAGAVKLNYENVHLNKLIDNLNTFYKPTAKENNIDLISSKGLDNFNCIIKIDKTKLNQILTNLLSNAFKFTDKGTIEFGYKLINDTLQFFVKDSGIGIEEKLLDQIFDRFIQANVVLNKKHKGTGLGLAISKKLVEMFHGKIWIESNQKGTSVFFTIPYKKSSQNLITTVIEQKKPMVKINNEEFVILVAEDEEYNMMYINELFSKTSYKIIEANNGQEAVDLATKHPEINLILMDIKMPIKNGQEAMKEIKKLRPQLPIVALSAFAMESDIENAKKNGFDSYLTKPINKKLLFEVVNKYS